MKKNHINKFRLSSIINFIFFVIFTIVLITSSLWLYTSSVKLVQNETYNYLKQSSKIVEIVLNKHIKSLEGVTQQIASGYKFKLSGIKNYENTELYLESMFTSNNFNSIDLMFLHLFDDTIIDSSVSIFDNSSLIKQIMKEKKRERIYYKQVEIHNRVVAVIIVKEEIIDADSGRHIGDLYGGIVLNDNFTLMNELNDLLNVKALAFIAKDQIISRHESKDFLLPELKSIKRGELYIINASIIKKMPISIKTVNTNLELLLISSSNSYNVFKGEFFIKTLVILLLVFLLFMMTNKFIKKLIESPLQKLLLFASHTVSHKDIKEYEDNEVLEFNTLGHDFEKLISRIKKMTNILKNLVKKRTLELSEKTEKVAELLNNAGQGFLSINRDFIINGEYSLECENIMGKNLKNKDIVQLLFSNQEKKIEFFKETIIDALNEENELTSNLMLSLLPKEIIIQKRAIKIEYKVISHEKLMLVLTNVTDKKKLELRVKKEQKILTMIVHIASDSVEFFEIKENYEQFCTDIKLYINKKCSAAENANTIYVVIHTFKGLFSQLYMRNTVGKLHEAETELLSFLEDKINSNYFLEATLLSFELESSMDDDLKLIRESLGDKFLEEKYYLKIDEDSILKIEDNLSHLVNESQSASEEHKLLLKDIKMLRNKTLKYYLSSYPKSSLQLSISLNKNIYPFEIQGDCDISVSGTFRPFIYSLVHVFRNACYHGIEEKHTRVLLGKNEVGTISCSYKVENNDLYLEVLDDGQGINIEVLKNKIVQKKLLPKDKVEIMDNAEILSYLFEPNFSTSETITEISGRGVGLYAVKKELDKLKGKVEVITEVNKGTSFIFKIPLIEL